MRYIFFALFILVSGWVIFLSPVFVVRRIECYTQFGTCPSSLLSPLQQYKNARMFSRFATSQLQSGFSQNSQVVQVSLYRRLPSTLVFNLRLRRPIGTVANSVLGAQSVVDDSGIIYSTATNSALPLLLLDSPSSNLDSDQVTALKILNQIGETSPQRLVGELQGTKLVVNYPQGLSVLIDINQTMDAWYPALQLILQRSKIDGKLPHKIDMRFTNPVVTY